MIEFEQIAKKCPCYDEGGCKIHSMIEFEQIAKKCPCYDEGGCKIHSMTVCGADIGYEVCLEEVCPIYFWVLKIGSMAGEFAAQIAKELKGGDKMTQIDRDNIITKLYMAQTEVLGVDNLLGKKLEYSATYRIPLRRGAAIIADVITLLKKVVINSE